MGLSRRSMCSGYQQHFPIPLVVFFAVSFSVPLVWICVSLFRYIIFIVFIFCNAYGNVKHLVYILPNFILSIKSPILYCHYKIGFSYKYGILQILSGIYFQKIVLDSADWHWIMYWSKMQDFINLPEATTIHKILETNSSLYVKQRTTGKVQFLFFSSFLLIV